MYLVHRCGELVAHIQNTNTQYNLPAFNKKLSRKYNHAGVAEQFENPEVRTYPGISASHAFRQEKRGLW